MVTSLSPEVVSLIHYIELNDTKLHDNAIHRLVLAAVWLHDKPASSDELRDRIVNDFSVTLSPQTVAKSLQSLCHDTQVVALSGGRFQIAASFIDTLNTQLADAERVEAEAANLFVSRVQATGLAIDPVKLWDSFRDTLLIPLVKTKGVRTYQIASGEVTPDLSLPSFEDFLQGYDAKTQDQIRLVIRLYLHPATPEVKRYILRLLHTQLCLQACTLDASTLRSLRRLPAYAACMQIYLDTNVVFSVLELHENPANESAQLLVSLIRQHRDTLNAELRILPPTVAETKRSLSLHLDQCKGICFTSNILHAIDAAGPLLLSGLSQKYARACQDAGHPISATEYFGPYMKNLVLILRERGIELHNEDLDPLRTDQQVVDDILAQQKYQETLELDRPKRPKRYEMLEHDTLLWHYVKRKRPRVVESPADAVYWIATVDHRFLGFDAFKRRQTGHDIPICIEPGDLVDLLQFWLPRSPDLDDALFASILWPFFLQEFDAAAENAVLRILKALSRFENVGDLPETALKEILTNRALQLKITAEPNMDAQVVLIRDALTQQLAEREKEVRQTRETNITLQQQLVHKDTSIQHLEERVSEYRQQMDALQTQAKQSYAHQASLNAQLARLENEVNLQRQQQQVRAARLAFATWWILLSLVFSTASYLLAALSLTYAWRSLAHPYGVAAIAPAICLIVLLVIVTRKGRSISAVQSWRPFQVLARFRGRLITVISALALSIAGNACYSQLVQLVHWFQGSP